MSTSIIYAPPHFSESEYAAFLDWSNTPVPWSVTAEEYAARCQESKFLPTRRRPAKFATDEPGRWRDVLFEPGDVVEFRCLPPRFVADANAPLRFMPKKTAFANRLFCWEFAQDIEFAVNKLVEMNTGVATWWGVRQRKVKVWTDVTVLSGVPLNVYAAPNPRIAKRCSKSDDVLLARNLFADIDNITVEAALVRLALTGLPMPTMIVVSGNGVHFYWRLELPITDLSLWTTLQKRLIRLLGSDEAVHDPARVMRIPGFRNVNKNAQCFIHKADPGRRYALADIERHLPPSPTPTYPPKSKPPTRPHLSIVGEEMPATPDADRDVLLRRATAYADRFEPADDGERNSWLFARTCNLVEKFALTTDEALDLGRKTNAESDAPLDDGEVVEVVGKAVAHIGKKGGPKGTPPKVVRVQHHEADAAEVVSLESWRVQMREARLESLNAPGVYLDSSTTGAGKSTADLEAMRKAKRSLTVLPTHDACTELVAELTERGLKAAAHPPLDASTCEQFGTPKRPGPAQTALKAGLNVGVAVCPTCKHAKTCEYQKRREAARTADHAVATHARASNSEFHAAADKPLVFVHEDALALFRPMVKVVRHATDPDAPQASHLRQIAEIAAAAEGIARTWGKPELIRLSQRLRSSATYLSECLLNDSLIGPLTQAVEKGLPTTGLPTVEPLVIPTSTVAEQPDVHLVEDVTGFAVSPTASAGLRGGNTDLLLHDAMQKVGFPRNGDALQLAVAHASGELKHLCAVIDEEFVAGKKDHKKFHKSLVGVWGVQPPQDSVVWLENAHAQAQWVSEVVGRPVIDKTPHGRLAYRVPPVQYADKDVTQRTAGSVVRGLLRKVLALHPAARKVGVITHRCHLPEIDKLDPLWLGRICRKEYFHSGKDRASNSWLGCDLIVVLGTPRLPPKAVRDGLIRLGRVDAASKDGKHGEIEWEGVTVKGTLARHRGLGYGEPSWAEMHDSLVKEAMLQAVGRGRGVTDKGVPVVVVSNEPLGLTLADEPLTPLTDPQAETYRVVVGLTVQNAKDTSLAIRTVTTAEVTALSPYKESNVRKLLSSLSSHGLLTK